ncbi:SapC family protein [Cronbergia sp. UHCC 0137]|uniref:SapC family protein n=1 Tax=Cronbergia sp. UHCC 0137 TaxID=3110239 RepID=UPI002B1F8FDA|nr:SapC family protein [Cronbergia sp. UHCC 0137]MEA5616594.1 SapC family protein [Cronbergia sp. UHCC 0137]
MPTQLLIYKEAIPVSKLTHKDWSINTNPDFSFAQGLNSVPLMSIEFTNAVTEYPIVFTGTEEEIIPAVILGIKSEENLYVAQNGTWEGKYIPAFVRRYPFVFSSNDNGENFTLYIDQEFVGWNQDGIGERLFDDQGEQTQYLVNILGFLQEYQVQFQRTQNFCKKLKELNLLEPMKADFTLITNEKTSLTGFMGINQESLKKLSSEQLMDLMQSDELELVYLHLQSMRNLSALVDRMSLKASQNQQQQLVDKEATQLIQNNNIVEEESIFANTGVV